MSNLKNGKATSPELFKDLETYRTAYGYDSADASKRKVLDGYWQATQPQTADAFYQILKQGQPIEYTKIFQNPEYKTALDRFNQFNQYKNYDASQFSEAVRTGKLIKGSKVYSDLMADPISSRQLRQAEQLNTINRDTENDDTITQNATNNILKTTPNLKQAFEDEVLTVDEYNKLF